MTPDDPPPNHPPPDDPAPDDPAPDQRSSDKRERRLSPDQVVETETAEEGVRRRAAARRRLAEIFGDVLPDASRDDVDEPGQAAGEHSASARDAALLRDVPPHHTP